MIVSSPLLPLRVFAWSSPFIISFAWLPMMFSILSKVSVPIELPDAKFDEISAFIDFTSLL